MRNVLVGLGVVALVIVAVGIGVSLGSKPNNAGSSSTAKASASASTVAMYKSATDLLAAMAAGGAVCGNAQFQTGSTVQGAQSAYIGGDGVSSGDTVLEMFTSHAGALAYANRMINSGATTNTPTAEVVGPNWAVNTVPSFATQVQRAVGGQLINGQPVTQSAAPAPAPSPTATVLRYSGTSNWNSPPFTITGNNMTVTYTYSGNQDSNFITACGRAGAAVRGSRRVHRAFVRRTRAKLPPPQRRDPGNPRPPAAGHPAAPLSLGCSRLLP